MEFGKFIVGEDPHPQHSNVDATLAVQVNTSRRVDGDPDTLNAYQITTIEIERVGGLLRIIADHSSNPDDGREMFTINTETGEIRIGRFEP